MKDTIIIIPCGARKQSGSHLAQHLYTGPYFKACLHWALSNAEPANIFILSAKYGLLALDDCIETYEMRMGNPGSIQLKEVRQQAYDRDLIQKHCIAIGGRSYTGLCKQIWINCETPLEGKGGQGKQIHWLKYNHGILET